MNIYFAGSIRGGRDDSVIYSEIIKMLSNYGKVLTEHVGSKYLSDSGEVKMSSGDIFKRDMDWLADSEIVVAEVTTPSLGVGYEIGAAEAMGKKIICLYRSGLDNKLSAMIRGNDKITNITYNGVQELESFFGQLLKP